MKAMSLPSKVIDIKTAPKSISSNKDNKTSTQLLSEAFRILDKINK